MTRLINIILLSVILLTACGGPPTATTSIPLSPVDTSPAELPVLEPSSTAVPQPEAKTLDLVMPDGSRSVLDDFEGASTTWFAGKPPDYSDSTAVRVEISKDNQVVGYQSLALAFNFEPSTEGSQNQKAIFNKEGMTNLSNVRYLAFALSDPDRALDSISVALSTGGDWYWHESAPVKMNTLGGVNLVLIDLTSPTWKTAQTNWEPTAILADANLVNRISVIIYPRQAGRVYLDYLAAIYADAVTIQAECPGAPESPSDNAYDQDTPLFISPPSTQPVQYQKLEFRIFTDPAWTVVAPLNPFDPAQADLVVHYISPRGDAFTVPAFWMQDYHPQTSLACGTAGWRARFTPTQPGDWVFRAEWISTASLESSFSDPLIIEVIPAASLEKTGFIRVHPENPRYFAYDSGETYFPVGLNIGWWQDDPLPDYRRWFDRLSENGGNIARNWMASWSFGLEWSDTGLGNYAGRQYQAWLLDQVFQMAEERGIYIELVLSNHGQFSATTNPQWHENPYNAVLGGPCQTPVCFVTDETAKDFFKRRLRYIAARWGYSTHLFAWEWWNEVNLTPIQSKELVPWLQEMTPYLLQFDPNDHLVSLSYSGPGNAATFELPEVDFGQLHVYSTSDPMDYSPDQAKFGSVIAKDKPYVYAEFGFSAGVETVESPDPGGVHLHNGLWSATFAGFASPAMYWWWDLYIDPLNLWGQYQSLITFLDGIDLAEYLPSQNSLSVDNNHVKVMALKSPLGSTTTTHLLGWLRHAQYEAKIASRSYELARRAGALSADWRYIPEEIPAITLTVKNLEEGAYTLQWYDPYTQVWADPAGGMVQNGALTLGINTPEGPQLVTDLAFKLEKK